MRRVMSFNFNINYFLAKHDDGRYFLEREYIGEESVYFDMSDNYKPLRGGTRYVTQPSRRIIERELETRRPDAYRTLFDVPTGSEPEPEATPKPKETSDIGMEELLTKLNEQNMKMMKEMMGHNPYEDAIVEAIIEKGKHISTEYLVEDAKIGLEDFIKKEYGSLPTKLEVSTPKVQKQMTGIFHNQFDKIFKIVERNIPLMLVGPAGSGKNHTLEQISEALELDFYFTNAITQEYKLTGFIDANGHFHETQFYKAFKNGGLFFLDEMDASIPEVLIILNAAIANKYFDFPNGRIDAHEDFRVVSAANTVGTGADNLYVGRNQLDAATLDRFAVIEFNYDIEVERQLASSDELFEFVQGLRATIERLDIRYVVSMRATINASKVEDILDHKTILDTIILKGMSQDEKDMVMNKLDVPSHNPYKQVM